MRTKILSLIGCLCAALCVRASVVTFTPDNTTVIKNPERGYTEELSRKVSENNPNVVKGHVTSSFGGIYQMSLAVVLYNFNHFKAQDLPEVILNGFDEDMEELRTCGLKCVLRFAYSESMSDKEDATPDWVERHLEQLKPHLEQNADVIYVVEAGFVGVWGEWYYTKNYGNESQHMNANRRRVIDALLASIPADRFVLFRYPMIKTEYLGDATPLSSAEAFSDSDRSRMGCHNDAFLNSWGNDGTYASEEMSDDPAVREYVAKETLFVPNGGETNVENSSLAESVYASAPAEMSAYHWSFCGKSYATQVTTRWKNSGIFDTLNIHMGYRYNLLNGQFSDKAAPSGKMNMVIRVRNSGYAPMYNERPVYLVFSRQNSAFSIQLKADPRRWLPNGVVSQIREQVQIPSEVEEGTYHLYLWMPDRYESIRNNPRYAVRFANTDVWEEQTGYNDLKATITIDKNAPMDPGPLPEGIETVSDQQSAVRPTKVIEDGIFYILMPDGRKYYSF